MYEFKAAIASQMRPCFFYSRLHAGSLQVVLEDVYHSPVGSRDGTGDKKGRLWYGSEPVLEQWFHHLTDDSKEGEGGVVSMKEILDVTAPVEPGSTPAAR